VRFGRPGGGFADDEFGLYLDERGEGLVGHALEESGGGFGAHELEGLTDGGETGDLVGGGLDVVEANDGDVVGDVEAVVVEGADAAHGGDVVEAEDGGEFLFGFEEVVDAGVADFR